MIQKVFVLHGLSDEENSVQGVFSSEEAAESAKNILGGFDRYEIIPFEIDVV